MLTQTNGIVIKENNVGEQDRLVTLLTEKLGVIRAFARGARSVKSKSLSATGLFAYSHFYIWCSTDKYVIREAEVQEVFFGLRDDIEKIALAQYFAQLALELAPQEENSKDYLRLMLNTLHFLSENKKPSELLKSIYEMRILSMAGYMPRLECCVNCGRFESPVMYFDARGGELFCSDCSSDGMRLSLSALSALRHIVYSDFEKLFSFTLGGTALNELSGVTERFLLEQTERKYTTLDFYNSLR